MAELENKTLSSSSHAPLRPLFLNISFKNHFKRFVSGTLLTSKASSLVQIGHYRAEKLVVPSADKILGGKGIPRGQYPDAPKWLIVR